MTRSKHESTATSKLVNLTTKRDSVFMAFSVGVVIVPTQFWRENAVFAYPSWLRLCRVRGRKEVRKKRGQVDFAIAPPCGTLVSKASNGFVTSTVASIATGWSDPVAGWELHPLKTPTFH